MFGGFVVLFHGIYDDASVHLNWRESYQITMASLAATRLLSAGGAGGLVLQAWALRRAGLPARDGGRPHRLVHRRHLPRLHGHAWRSSGSACTPGSSTGRRRSRSRCCPRSSPSSRPRSACRSGFVPPDLQRRLIRFCDDPRRSRRMLARLAQLPASASAGIRDALHRVRPPRHRPVGRDRLLGLPDRRAVGELPRVRRVAAAGHRDHGVLHRDARQPAAAARRHRRRRRRHDRRVRGPRRRRRTWRSSPCSSTAASRSGCRRSRASSPTSSCARRSIAGGPSGRRPRRRRNVVAAPPDATLYKMKRGAV